MRLHISKRNALKRAQELIDKMTNEEKYQMVCGDGFAIKENKRLGIPRILLFDGSQGIHLRENVPCSLERSTAFPSTLMLAATWNRSLFSKYAESIGEECRAGGIHVLLGPGMNIYRISQNGRNFEYLGEDPFLASEVVKKYVAALQRKGVIATLKHFVCNNTDWYRKASNSIMDKRALNEIYLPAFKAGIDAGAMAVMTSYNYFNGEHAGQSRKLITDILKKELKFRWMVMTDWSSVDDGLKVAESGQDLEMPRGEELLKVKDKLLGSKEIERMVRNILKTCIAMGFYDREQTDQSYISKMEQHNRIALKVAEEGAILLKNNGILPLKIKNLSKILVTGNFVEQIPFTGSGAAEITGYDYKSYLEVLKSVLENSIKIDKKDNPVDSEIKSAETIFVFSGYPAEGEGMDRSFNLPHGEEELIQRCVNLNKNTIVIITAGSGVQMNWSDRSAAILLSLYGGQRGAEALVNILTGKINPSGRLPFTIEKNFKDSPGAGYIPEGGRLYNKMKKMPEAEEKEKINCEWPYPVEYKESIFVGYRWYEKKNKDVSFCFGHGLSYTHFQYSNLYIDKKNDNSWTLSFKLKNTGEQEGYEISQLYIANIESRLERPVKELKGFKKVFLKPGEIRTVKMHIGKHTFEYYDPEQEKWIAENVKFKIMIGSSVKDIKLEGILNYVN